MAIRKFKHHKINGAIKVLNGVAQERKEEMRKLLNCKYVELRKAVEHAGLEGKRALRRFQKVTEGAFEEGTASIRHSVKNAEKNIRKNPWPYIGAASASALALGVALGKKKK